MFIKNKLIWGALVLLSMPYCCGAEIVKQPWPALDIVEVKTSKDVFPKITIYAKDNGGLGDEISLSENNKTIASDSIEIREEVGISNNYIFIFDNHGKVETDEIKEGAKKLLSELKVSDKVLTIAMTPKVATTIEHNGLDLELKAKVVHDWISSDKATKEIDSCKELDRPLALSVQPIGDAILLAMKKFAAIPGSDQKKTTIVLIAANDHGGFVSDYDRINYYFKKYTVNFNLVSVNPLKDYAADGLYRQLVNASGGTMFSKMEDLSGCGRNISKALSTYTVIEYSSLLRNPGGGEITLALEKAGDRAVNSFVVAPGDIESFITENYVKPVRQVLTEVNGKFDNALTEFDKCEPLCNKISGYFSDADLNNAKVKIDELEDNLNSFRQMASEISNYEFPDNIKLLIEEVGDLEEILDVKNKVEVFKEKINDKLVDAKKIEILLGDFQEYRSALNLLLFDTVKSFNSMSENWEIFKRYINSYDQIRQIGKYRDISWETRKALVVDFNKYNDDRAVDVLKDYIDLFESKGDDLVPSQAYLELSLVYANLEKQEEALELAKQIENAVPDDSLVKGLAKVFALCKENEKARMFYGKVPQVDLALEDRVLYAKALEMERNSSSGQKIIAILGKYENWLNEDPSGVDKDSVKDVLEYLGCGYYLIGNKNASAYVFHQIRQKGYSFTVDEFYKK